MKRIILLLFLLFAGMYYLSAQTKITGTVTSAEDGSPIPGVSVAAKDATGIGAVTNFEGKYSLEIPAGTDVSTLVFTFIGMQDVEEPVSGRSVINVQMQSEDIALKDVVVTALGIKRSEKAIGYASTTVGADEITKSRSSDVMSALAGKVAGVDINVTSSSPGASNAVIIRGMSSLGGSNQPLYVVDGIPIINTATQKDDNLNSYYDFGAGNQMINPNDVESVTVLKGAAASALYGNRASNGVVLITTKEGHKGKGLEVTYNSSFEMSDLLRLPTYQDDFGMGWDGHHTLIENGSWGPKLDGTTRLWGRIYNNSQKLKPFEAMPDNVKDFFEYGMSFKNSLSVSGGTDKSTYYASLSHIDDNGVIPGDNDQMTKYTATFKGSQEFNRLKITSSINLSRQNNNFVPTGQGFTVINNISQIPRDISIIGLKDYKDDPFDQMDYYFTPYGVINPYYSLDNLSYEYEAQKVFGKIELEYEILDNLKATYRLAFDGSDNESKNSFPRIITTPGTPNYGEFQEPGFAEKFMTRRREINQDLLLTYDKSFGDFTLNALAGVNILDYKMSYLNAEIGNLDIPDFFGLTNSSETPSISEDFSRKRMVGILGNAELSYKDMIFLTLSGRQDYTSTLPEDNNSYFYPGTQLSFVFSELLPSSLEDIISFGKVRLAYGKVGKDANPYLLDPYFVAATLDNPFGDINFPLSGQNAYEVGNRLANLSLQPEIRTESEAGIRMDFLKGRFGFDVSVYQSVSKEQIYNLGLDYATGYTSQTTNLGEIENKGIELMVNATPVQFKDFEWYIDFNYTKNNEELVSLPEELGEKVTLGGLSTIGFVAQVGQPLGLFEVTVPQETADGQIVVDEDGQPVAAPEKEIVPKAAFDYTMGFTNTFRYKNLSLSVDLDIRQGGRIYSRTKDINAFTGNMIESIYNDRRPFVIPNSVQPTDDADGQMDDDGSDTYDYVENTTPITDQGIVTYWSNGANKLDKAWLLPRSYTKLKRVVLSYTLPKKIINNIPIKGVTVSVFGNNLFLWTPEDNHYIDPESSTFGNDLESRYGEFSVNPPTRSFGANLKLIF